MALRVLLADESPTIKKVFQLALQDYAVEVASVALGPDVANVSRQFKPDIIFVDVLVQKKNGYDVCAEIKQDPQLTKLPVVLMWSNFMELDQDKAQAARADGSLEKPFDVDDLRSLVRKLVPKTKSQRLSNFLNFPSMPEMIETPPPPSDRPGSPEPEPPPANWNMDSFEPMPNPGVIEADEFQEVPLPPAPRADELIDLNGDDAAEAEATQWSARPLGRFNVGEQAAHADDVAVVLPDEDGSAELDVEARAEPEIELEEPTRTPPAARSPAAAPSASSVAGLDEAKLERLVREQAIKLIESIAWKVVPELANQIIERELKRLLSEKSP